MSIRCPLRHPPPSPRGRRHDAPFRAEPDDIAAWYVRGSTGEMAPFSSFANVTWGTAPSSLSRFGGFSS